MVRMSEVQDRGVDETVKADSKVSDKEDDDELRKAAMLRIAKADAYGYTKFVCVLSQRKKRRERSSSSSSSSGRSSDKHRTAELTQTRVTVASDPFGCLNRQNKRGGQTNPKAWTEVWTLEFVLGPLTTYSREIKDLLKDGTRGLSSKVERGRSLGLQLSSIFGRRMAWENKRSKSK